MDTTGPVEDGASSRADAGDLQELQRMVGAGERRRSEVVAGARAAGLIVDEEGGLGTQLLRFANGLNSDELKLMELPHDVLGALREGERLVTTSYISDTLK